jgi:hypothetical protein
VGDGGEKRARQRKRHQECDEALEVDVIDDLADASEVTQRKARKDGKESIRKK